MTQIPCPNCIGTGLVARPVAPIAEGDHVRRYVDSMFGQEVCTRCGGGGVVALDPKDVSEPQPAAWTSAYLVLSEPDLRFVDEYLSDDRITIRAPQKRVWTKTRSGL